ncbi:hypothetical protein ACWD0Z_06310 [Streptomyces sp. NPDC003007]|uniref:Uncharacterized protein n=1 Tax=Streptomyces cahuitamycinicus TaxID=2070367 RepID=A0A2N8TER1_9ACTN|nr:hypothetical protein [Streptomyces cahuitamycinicus]PNG17487.1 hypothetical protein C1J00_36240 [Streptomyces cahuitamycinicus]
MSVSISLVTKVSSKFEDNEQEGRFSYLIHPSGALCVMVSKGSEQAKIHKAYGPAAWLSAEGESSQ